MLLIFIFFLRNSVLFSKLVVLSYLPKSNVHKFFFVLPCSHLFYNLDNQREIIHGHRWPILYHRKRIRKVNQSLIAAKYTICHVKKVICASTTMFFIMQVQISCSLLLGPKK